MYLTIPFFIFMGQLLSATYLGAEAYELFGWLVFFGLLIAQGMTIGDELSDVPKMSLTLASIGAFWFGNSLLDPDIQASFSSTFLHFGFVFLSWSLGVIYGFGLLCILPVDARYWLHNMAPTQYTKADVLKGIEAYRAKLDGLSNYLHKKAGDL